MVGKNITLCLSLNILLLISSARSLNSRYFPEEFSFGVGTSAYQIEGAWNEDGKGESVWDHTVHTNPSFVANNETGDITSDEYHKWKEDLQLLKDLGVNHYRFSLSWTRILPTGFANKINEAGINYYKNLIKALKENNIEPVITLHHWDYPQTLQNIGGWTNPKLADYFADYARVAFRELGHDVKYWTTFNEPIETCRAGFESGTLPPCITSPGIGEYMCAYTVVLAHAKAYHIYDEEFRPTQNGSVSIVLNFGYVPASESQEDIEATERGLQFFAGIFANPLFYGNWPQIVIDRIKYRSEGENFSKSRLPEFTAEEIEYINGTIDFFCLNHYTVNLVKDIEEARFGEPSGAFDQRISAFPDPSWNSSSIDWLKIVPWGLRKTLQWIKKTYNNPKILITENGVPDNVSGTLQDDERISYINDYLSSVLDAIYEDEVNVIGYTVWCFMDDFEFNEGYSVKFGLYQVDFGSDNRTRTPKKSAEYYKKIISTRCLVNECQ